MMQLRPFQLEAVERIREHIRRGCRKIVLVAPTGSGKTVIMSHIIQHAVAKDKTVLFLVHRVELAAQGSEKLDSFGVDHGVIMSSHPRRRPWLKVQIASVPTLTRRLNKLPPADLIFCDETHRIRGKSWQKLLAAYPQAVVVGATATPLRADGLGLGEFYQEMVSCPSVNALTRMGYLVTSRVYAPAKPDVSKVTHDHKTGDYATGALAEVMDRQVLVGDIVQHWLRLARREAGGVGIHILDRSNSGTSTDRRTPDEENNGTIEANGKNTIGPRTTTHLSGTHRPTVCFAVSVAHSRHIVEQFQAAGVAAEHLDGETPAAERKRILEDLASGKLDLVSNCEVLTEGWDCPAVSCAILARPTESLGLYLQMVGRILRPAPGKLDALIIDHSGMVHRHGFPDDDREWVLAGDREYRRDATDKTPGVKICPQCFLAMSAKVRECPNCGTAPPLQNRVVAQVEGELREETGGRASECILCGCRHGDKWKCLTCGGDMLPVPRRVRMGVAV